ncbi:Multidrug export protein MepA [bioreactor metagenome]|uniref:Multidrug export protein MepA n=1 Tax=bioreactor metagenome TaxID=1076179 RepID=A0A644WWR0_9ZZZZ
MTETPVSKLIITLGIPTTVSMLVTNIYNMADTYFVGKISTSASGAVGIVFGLMSIIQAFGFMLGQGAGSIISRKLGEKDVEIASRFASTGFFYALGSGVMISILSLTFLNPLMRLLGSTDTILPYARTYSIFILAAAPLMVMSFVMNTILRYEGKASLAMIGLLTGAILNIFGDWFLMTKLNMGIAGAGLSTALSQMVSFFVLLSMFLRGKVQSRISFRLVSKDRHDIMKIAETGFPSMMRQGLSSISVMILNGQAGIYGDAAVAAMAIVNRISFFIFAVGLGIGQGFQPVSAFNYGAKKYSRVRKGFFFTLTIEEVLLSCLAILGIILSPKLIAIFRNDPDVIAVGTFALSAQLVALFFQPLVVCENMMFQSIGRNRSATFISALRSGLIFIPIISVLPHFWGITGVELSQPVSDFITFFIAIPFLVLFFRELPDDTQL